MYSLIICFGTSYKKQTNKHKQIKSSPYMSKDHIHLISSCMHTNHANRIQKTVEGIIIRTIGLRMASVRYFSPNYAPGVATPGASSWSMNNNILQVQHAARRSPGRSINFLNKKLLQKHICYYYSSWNNVHLCRKHGPRAYLT